MRDVRVVAVDPDLAGGYCARLFASVGADVVFVEPADGARLRRHEPMLPGADGMVRSAMWEHLATGSRSAVGPAIDLVRGADIVVSSCDGDADAALAFDAQVRTLAPSAVHVVTSGYGLTGPYRDWLRTPLTDWAAGGHLALTGEPDREPLQGGGPWVSYLTGATAAIGAMAALVHAARTGEGQLVDVGALEAVASLHQWTITMYTHTGVIKRRWGNRFGESVHPIALYQCRDGSISITSPAVQQFEALCIAIDAPDLLLDPDIAAPAVRFDRAAEIDARIEPWLAARTCAEAVSELQAAGVPASHVLTMSQVLDDEQLAHRNYWVRSAAFDARLPRAPFAMAGAPVPSPAPLLGEHTAAVVAEVATGRQHESHPSFDLADMRALEFGIAWAGPLAARWLGDLGVDVVKVEHPATRGVSQRTDVEPGWRRGEPPAAHLRFPVFPDAVPGERWWNRMGIFNKMNRSKRSIGLDAKTGDGGEVLAGLIAASDIVLHNYSPRGARSLGIDAPTVERLRSDAVTVAMTGYGETGPLSGYLSYGPVLQAHGGFDEATGYEGGDPVRIGVAFPDAVGGVHGAFAALVALWERQRTGEAVHVDLSQLETLLSIAGEMLLAADATGESPRRHGNRAAGLVPQGVYRSVGDDAWLAVSVRDDEEWRRLVDLLDDPLLAGLRNAGIEERSAELAAIDGALDRWSSQRTPHKAAAALQGARIPAFPVMTNGMIVEDPHVRERGFVVTWDQVDAGPLAFPGFPIHFSGMDVRIRPCPGLGADNDAVLAGVLGYDAERIAELWATGVVGDRPPT